MIPNHWYPVVEARRVRRRPLGIRRFGERLVLWRATDGEVVCMRDRCPHRGVALSRGRVVEGCLECPYHGFRYAKDGACTRMPCEGRGARIPKTLRVPTFCVREAYDLVWVFYGEVDEDRALPEIPWFDEVGETWEQSADWSVEWPCNFVRTLESNFDIHHFPFVHRSLAFGTGAVLDPYHVEVEGTHIKTWGKLRKDDERADKEDAGLFFRVEYKAPSLTYLQLSDKLCGVIADCPIDEETTWRYARYRQRYVPLPLVGRLVAWLGLWFEFKVVQPQDLRVLETQEPRLPDVAHDHLVRADRGIAAFLKLRRRLKEEAEARAEVRPSA